MGISSNIFSASLTRPESNNPLRIVFQVMTLRCSQWRWVAHEALMQWMSTQEMYKLSWPQRIFGRVPCKKAEQRGRNRDWTFHGGLVPELDYDEPDAGGHGRAWGWTLFWRDVCIMQLLCNTPFVSDIYLPMPNLNLIRKDLNRAVTPKTRHCQLESSLKSAQIGPKLLQIETYPEDLNACWLVFECA